jgi:two-component system response regulator AtoC
MKLIEKLMNARGAGIRIIDRFVDDLSDEDWDAFTAEALQLGYVTVDAKQPAAEKQRRRLWHRHVVLIHRGTPTSESIRWVRELSGASPRAHAVVVIAPQPDRVHESGACIPLPLELAPASGASALEVRSERFSRRRRFAAARRWAVAAVERARRRDDEEGAARAFARIAAQFESGTNDAACSLIGRGRRLLAGMERLGARSEVAAALGDLWIASAELEAAAAVLAATAVECELTGFAVPAWIRERQCELACWEGCWDRADEWGRECGHLGWRAIAALARRDWASLRMFSIAAAHPDETGGEWSRLITAMSHGAGGDARGVSLAVESMKRLRSRCRWRDALILESLRMAGDEDASLAWIAAVGSHPRGRAEQLLWDWIVMAPRTAALEAEVRRLGAGGVRRWGQRRRDMHVWAGVSSLLTQIQEAEDSYAAMKRGCSWAREYTALDAVAIVSTEGVIVAGDPEGARPSGSIVSQRVAVRYGGVRIGDVVTCGASRDELEARSVATALATACAPALRARIDELQVARAGESLAGELLGVSQAMRALREAAARAATSTFPVLIEGESGTGKELVARAVHRLSARRDRRWAAVNCAALTDELLEAELFGHTRGAFTGAIGPRVGLMEDAHEGTLFLDEVAELSPRAQAKLLRVLQEGEIRRVGENASRRVDVRLVTATNRSLAEAARQGTYREDLIFRLAVIRLRVPPLRDRIEDVPVLAHAFWRTVAARSATRATLGPDAVAALCRASWPGNVRELQNFIAALAVGGPASGRIGARQVQELLEERACRDEFAPPMSLASARLQCDRKVVAASLARHANRAAAARELGVSRQGLAKLMARLNLGEEATISRL